MWFAWFTNNIKKCRNDVVKQSLNQIFYPARYPVGISNRSASSWIASFNSSHIAIVAHWNER